MATIATAEVRVIADTADFVRDLRRKLNQAFRGLGRTLADRLNSELSRRMGTQLTATMRGAGRDAAAAFSQTFASTVDFDSQFLRRDATEGGRALGYQLARGSAQGFSLEFTDSYRRALQQANLAPIRQGMTRIADIIGEELNESLTESVEESEGQIRRSSRRIGNALRDNIARGAGAASAAVQRLTRALASIASSLTLRPLAAMGNLFTDFTQTMAAAAAQGLILIGVLVQLSGVLGPIPAGITVLSAAVATAAIAFNGLGEALGASLGEAEAFEEAIEDLAPAAASVVREFRAFREELTQMRLDAQQALFVELDGAITRVGENLGGAFRDGVVAASGALGRLIDGVADFLSEAETADTVAAAFAAVSAIFEAMADEIQPLLRGLRTITDEFLPRFHDLEDTIDGIGTRFEEWARAITTPREELGGLSEAMDAFNQSVDFLGQSGRIIENVFRTVAAIFTATADNGVNLLGTIEALTATLAGLAESEAGQDRLGRFFDDLDRIVANLVPLVGTLVSELADLAGPVADILESVGPDLGEFIREIGAGLENLLREGQPFFEEFAAALGDLDLADLGQNLGELLAELAPVVELLGRFVGGVVAAASAVAGFFTDVQSDLNNVGDLFSGWSTDLGNFADEWLEFWSEDVFGVPDDQTIIRNIREFFEELAETLANPFGPAGTADPARIIGDWLNRAGEAIIGGLQALARQVQEAIDSFQEVWNDLFGSLTPDVSGLFTGVFAGLPGQVSLSLSGVTAAVQAWGAGLLEWLAGFLPSLNLSFLSFFTGLSGQTSLSLAGITELFRGWGAGLLEWATGFLGGLNLSFAGFFSGLTAESNASLLGLTGMFEGWGVGISAWWDGLWSRMGTRLSGAWSNFSSRILGSAGSIRGYLESWGGGLAGWWSGLWARFNSILSSRWSQIRGTFNYGVGGIRAALSGLIGTFRSIFSSIVNIVANAFYSIQGYLSSIRGVISSIQSATSGLSFGGFSFFADGGIVNGPTRAIVGEAGREAILPLTRPDRAVQVAVEAGIPQLLARAGVVGAPVPAASGGGASPQIHVHTANADPEQVARRAARLLQRLSGGRGLDRLE